MILNLPLSSIKVLRDERQRRTIVGIEELADSISRRGLIHPIVIDENNVLITGERRFRAHELLKLPTILCRKFIDLTRVEKRAIELEENIKRVDLPWEDRCKAVNDYHNLRKEENTSWSQENTAQELGLSREHITRLIMVAKELDSGNAMVAGAGKLSIAIGITERAHERRQASATKELHSSIGFNNEKEAEGTRNPPILNQDFIHWADTYDGPRFNFIHCDFPYGIGASDFDQGSARSHGGYQDTPENYWQLCDALARNIERIAHPTCHLIFWFSPKHYSWTLDFLSNGILFEWSIARLLGWTVNPYPLIWIKSDGAGILPDPARGPRQVYETAFFAYRGDARIIRAKANAFSAPSVRDTHMSEKNQQMLEHFFGMVVDSNTAVLDPTCGSGSAIRAARTCGAGYILGLEKDKEFAERAMEKWDGER